MIDTYIWLHDVDILVKEPILDWKTNHLRYKNIILKSIKNSGWRITTFMSSTTMNKSAQLYHSFTAFYFSCQDEDVPLFFPANTKRSFLILCVAITCHKQDASRHACEQADTSYGTQSTKYNLISKSGEFSQQTKCTFQHPRKTLVRWNNLTSSDCTLKQFSVICNWNNWISDTFRIDKFQCETNLQSVVFM